MAIADGKPSIMFCAPTGLGHAHPDLARWMLINGHELGRRQLLDKIMWYNMQSSRILLNRNMFVEEAIRSGWDYILMVDPDMRPDLYLPSGFADDGRQVLPTARSFIGVALEFLSKNPFAVIAAPACGDPPDRSVNVFRFRDGGPATRVTHEEAQAAVRDPNPAVEQVAAIGTGLMMIPTAIFAALKRPFFDDEYANDGKTELAKSQDIYFTESCSASGIPVFCAWMCWAGHHKSVVLGCPGVDGQWATASMKRAPPFSATIGPDQSWQPPVTLARAGA